VASGAIAPGPALEGAPRLRPKVVHNVFSPLGLPSVRVWDYQYMYEIVSTNIVCRDLS
jgi:hypothetical protein